jgi:hypothetical protein
MDGGSPGKFRVAREAEAADVKWSGEQSSIINHHEGGSSVVDPDPIGTDEAGQFSIVRVDRAIPSTCYGPGLRARYPAIVSRITKVHSPSIFGSQTSRE